MTTVELREKLLKTKLGLNILSQGSDVVDIYDMDADIDFKILFNGKEISDPFAYIENVNKAIEDFLNNLDKEIDDCAKNIINEKYEDLYVQSLDISRAVEELHQRIKSEMECR